MLKEFKEFAVKGNVMDLAIGFIVGGAFSTIVSSLVNDVIMPPFGLILGKVDFKNLFFDLSMQGFSTLAAAEEAGAPTLNYGVFIQSVIDFLIVAGVLFLIVRAINRLRRDEEPEAEEKPAVKECPHCLSEIPAKATRCAFCTATVAAA